VNFHEISAVETAKYLNSDIKKGLTQRDADALLQKYGKNELRKAKKKSLLKRIIEQLSDYMIIILIIAAAISFFMSLYKGENDYIDSVIILAIVVLNAAIGLIQENRAEKALHTDITG